MRVTLPAASTDEMEPPAPEEEQRINAVPESIPAVPGGSQLMAAGGTIYVFLYHEKYKVVKLFFYLTMGFSPALVETSMSNTEGLHELACGGLIYFLGVVFFKNDGIILFVHVIWHLFMATAAAVHYYAIWKYLYPSPTDFMRHL
ncbi:Monocyte to macrophage differentiation factor, partial [Eschrichtius robustus]|nr:Monocyte to macrophage differentiation factor [Eschrichtius robustus]